MDPVAVRVNCGPPAVVDVGLIDVRTGAPFTTVKVCAFEVPPPGATFVTVTASVPAARTSAAVIVAVRVELETKVVPRAEPFQFTTEPETKFVPKTVRVKDELPAVVDAGERLVVAGTGFRIVKVSEPEVPPPGAGVTTVTGTVPAVAISAAGTSTVKVVLEIYVVASGLPFQ